MVNTDISKRKWSLKIESIDEVDSKIQDFFKGILVYAGIQIVVLGIASMSNSAAAINLLDPLFLVLVGWTIKKYRSRFFAVLFLCYTMLIGIITLLAKAGFEIPGFSGTNVFLALALIYLGILGVKATFYYASYYKLKVEWKYFYLSNLVLGTYLVIYFISLMTLYALIEPSLSPQLKSDEFLGFMLIVPCLILFWMKESRMLPGTIRYQKRLIARETHLSLSSQNDLQ